MSNGDAMNDACAVVTGRLRKLFATHADARAMQFEGRWIYWRDVSRGYEALRPIFAQLGVAAEAAVAIVMQQRPATLASELAVLASGRTSLLLNGMQGDRALADEIASLGASVVIAHTSEWTRPGFRDAVAAAGSVGVVADDDGTWQVTVRPGTVPSASVHDAAVTVQTSGTTGAPKRLPVSWSTFVELGGRERDPTADAGAMILSLPLVTLGGLLTVARLVFGGRPVALMERFNLDEWTALIKEHRPTTIGAPPPVVKMILDADIPPSCFEGVTAYVTSSAAVDPEVARAFEERYGFPVLLGYGATEFLGPVTGWSSGLWQRYGDAKRGSVGRPFPGVRLRVVDPRFADDAVELAPEVEGILEVDPPRRAEGLPSGWLRTSDRARIDEDGFLWILGRSDDVIVRGGFKVDLSALERHLRSHPDVADVALVSMPDDRVGAVPGAAIVRRPGTALSRKDVVAWIRDKFPPYASPAVVRFVEGLPVTETAKVRRAEVRRLLMDLAAPGGGAL